ncbi:MAG TPA: PsbP-related protein [Candidatus Nitrosopolaris sp.]|nr:PsbP-related protein [Candidatus Nitrosopolaris sp.]
MMYIKIFSAAATIGVTSLLVALSTSICLQSIEAMAQTPEQGKNSINSINFLTYENPMFGIKILYPANWDKQQNASSSNGKSNGNSTLFDLVAFSPPFKNTSDIVGKLIVQIDNISDIKPITLAQYANDTVSDLRQDFKVSESNATLAGNPAYKIVYTGQDSNVDLKALTVLTIKGDRAYIISYTAEPEKYTYYLPTVQKMIDSFEILK